MVEYINSGNSPYFLDLKKAQTQQLNLQEIRLIVDTTVSAIDITLPKISDFPTQNVKIYVTDANGNALANNITVTAFSGDSIGGSSVVVIKEDKGFLKLEIGSDFEWINYGSGSSSSSGSRIPITSVDFTGNDYTNSLLVGLTPVTGFNVFVNVGDAVAGNGTIVNPTDAYTFNAGTGTLTMTPDNYLIEIYGGGGSNTLTVSMTYAELTAAIGASNLITGQKIVLTDYATSYYLQYSGPGPTGIGGEEINVGAVEPLLLTAISSTEISMVAESISNPQDLILYLVTVADKDYDYAASSGTGCIIKRIDRKLDISRDYDWRTILFRRWETVIGNGNFWSYTPVAGAAFIDALGLGSNVQLAGNINIGSFKAAGALQGYPYWLDNTIFNSENVLIVNMGLAFGNTFTYFDDAGGSLAEFSSGETTNNVVVQNVIFINSFGDFAENNIIQTLNSQNGMLGNSVGGCAGNNIAEFYLNVGGGIDNNTCVRMSENNTSYIEANTAPQIIGNNVSIIQENTIAGEITANVGVQIKNNVANNITDNIVKNIEGNTAQQIIGNVCDSILNNMNNVTEITGNIGSLIENCSNIGGIIYNNFTNNITDISGTGSLDSLTGSVLNIVILNGDFKKSFGVFMQTVDISAQIDNANFNGEISGKTITPTGNMQSSNPSVIKYDFGLSEFVEEILTSGVVTYSAAITS